MFPLLHTLIISNKWKRFHLAKEKTGEKNWNGSARDGIKVAWQQQTIWIVKLYPLCKTFAFFSLNPRAHCMFYTRLCRTRLTEAGAGCWQQTTAEELLFTTAFNINITRLQKDSASQDFHFPSRTSCKTAARLSSVNYKTMWHCCLN